MSESFLSRRSALARFGGGLGTVALGSLIAESSVASPTMPTAGTHHAPRAKRVIDLAYDEARNLNNNYIGTEHLLLGLIKLGQGVAVNVLQKLGLDLETVRMEVEKQVGTGPDQKMMGNIPYTPRVKKVLALAQKEAKALNHTYVGTEHILLGLLREGDGVAAKVLKSLDIDIEAVRQEILKELDPNFQNQGEEAGGGGEGEKKEGGEKKGADELELDRHRTPASRYLTTTSSRIFGWMRQYTSKVPARRKV